MATTASDQAGTRARAPGRGWTPAATMMPPLAAWCSRKRTAECTIMHSMTTRDDSEPTSALARTIGRRVRAGRTELGWTLDQLAVRSGVSRRMLVNVEQGTTNPSIATLLRALRRARHRPAGAGRHRRRRVRAGRRAPGRRARPMWTSPAGGSAVMVAGTTPPDVTELWDWRLGPGETYPSEAHRAGTRELLLVLDRRRGPGGRRHRAPAQGRRLRQLRRHPRPTPTATPPPRAVRPLHPGRLRARRHVHPRPRPAAAGRVTLRLRFGHE